MDPFGPDRLITRFRGNILHELDGTSALALHRAAHTLKNTAAAVGAMPLSPLCAQLSDLTAVGTPIGSYSILVEDAASEHARVESAIEQALEAAPVC